MASLWQAGEKHEDVGVNRFRSIEDSRSLSQRRRSDRQNTQPVLGAEGRTLHPQVRTPDYAYPALSTLKVSVGGRMHGPVWPHVMSVWQDAVLILQFDDSTSDVRQRSVFYISVAHRFHEVWMYTMIHTSSSVPRVCLARLNTAGDVDALWLMQMNDFEIINLSVKMSALRATGRSGGEQMYFSWLQKSKLGAQLGGLITCRIIRSYFYLKLFERTLRGKIKVELPSISFEFN